MDYSFLTERQREALTVEHITALEMDHFRIALQVRDAADEVERGNRQAALREVERRIAVHLQVAQGSSE